MDKTCIPVPQLVELIELCSRSTYFQFESNFLNKLTVHPWAPPYPHHRQPLHGRPGGARHALSPTPTQLLVEVCGQYLRHLASWRAEPAILPHTPQPDVCEH